MLNCKIRLLEDYLALASKGETITIIDGESHYPDGFKGADNYTSISDFSRRNQSAKFEVIEMEGKTVKFEDNPEFADKLPRICYVLGGEKTPLKVNEEFTVTNRAAAYRITDSGVLQYRNDDMEFFAFCKSDTIYDLINGSQYIIRRPQFSEDEKALMRLYAKAGFPIFKPEAFQPNIVAWDKSEVHGRALPDGILMQIIDKFDAAAYLESEESK